MEGIDSVHDQEFGCIESGPILRDMTHDVATLGGFLGRRGDGEPGAQTLWLGLQRLDDIVAVWQAISGLPAATQTPVSSQATPGNDQGRAGGFLW